MNTGTFHTGNQKRLRGPAKICPPPSKPNRSVRRLCRPAVKTGRDVIGSSVMPTVAKKLRRFQLQGRFRIPAVAKTLRLHCSTRFVVNPACWRFFSSLLHYGIALTECQWLCPLVLSARLCELGYMKWWRVREENVPSAISMLNVAMEIWLK